MEGGGCAAAGVGAESGVLQRGGGGGEGVRLVLRVERAGGALVLLPGAVVVRLDEGLGDLSEQTAALLAGGWLRGRCGGKGGGKRGARLTQGGPNT